MPRCIAQASSTCAGVFPTRAAIAEQTLLKHDLVDAFWLKIFPVRLGGGKRLFADGTIPAAFKVTESTVTSKGVIIVNYERAGAVPTGRL